MEATKEIVLDVVPGVLYILEITTVGAACSVSLSLVTYTAWIVTLVVWINIRYVSSVLNTAPVSSAQWENFTLVSVMSFSVILA